MHWSMVEIVSLRSYVTHGAQSSHSSRPPELPYDVQYIYMYMYITTVELYTGTRERTSLGTRPDKGCAAAIS